MVLTVSMAPKVRHGVSSFSSFPASFLFISFASFPAPFLFISLHCVFFMSGSVSLHFFSFLFIFFIFSFSLFPAPFLFVSLHFLYFRVRFSSFLFMSLHFLHFWLRFLSFLFISLHFLYFRLRFSSFLFISFHVSSFSSFPAPFAVFHFLHFLYFRRRFSSFSSFPAPFLFISLFFSVRQPATDCGKKMCCKLTLKACLTLKVCFKLTRFPRCGPRRRSRLGRPGSCLRSGSTKLRSSLVAPASSRLGPQRGTTMVAWEKWLV